MPSYGDLFLRDYGIITESQLQFQLDDNILPVRTNKDILALNSHMINIIQGNWMLSGAFFLIDIMRIDPAGFLLDTILSTQSIMRQMFAIDFCGLRKGSYDITDDLFGEDVVATNSGQVIQVLDGVNDTNKPDGIRSLGNFVIIKHNSICYSIYAHLKRGSISVNEGDTIKKGQYIGDLGTSGNSQIPHLHFQMCWASPKHSELTLGFSLTSTPVSFNNFYCQDLTSSKIMDAIKLGALPAYNDKKFKQIMDNVDSQELKHISHGEIPSLAYVRTNKPRRN